MALLRRSCQSAAQQQDNQLGKNCRAERNGVLGRVSSGGRSCPGNALILPATRQAAVVIGTTTSLVQVECARSAWHISGINQKPTGSRSRLAPSHRTLGSA